MHLGNWESGVVKAIFMTSLVAPICLVAGMGMPHSVSEIAGLGMILLLFYSTYLFMSVIGWACVGFPSHWFICKFKGGRLVWYVLAVVLFAAAMSLLFQYVMGLIYGTVALIQVLLFKYYAYKPVNKR